MKLTGIKRFLPSKEIALERRKRTKPWLVGVLVLIFSPLLTLIYSYRQRTWDYILIWVSVFLFRLICQFLELKLLFFHFFVYSKYGALIACAIFAFIAAEDLQKKSIESSKSTENSRNKL